MFVVCAFNLLWIEVTELILINNYDFCIMIL